MTKKQQQIVAVAVMAVLALVAGAYMFAVKPKLAERSANQIATAAAATEATGLQAQLAALQVKRDGLPAAEAKVTELTAMFPNTFQQDKWFNTIRSLAAQSGVELSQITPGVPVASTGGATDPTAVPPPVDPNAPAADAATSEFLVAESAVSLDATGGNRALATFLAALENMERPLLIETVSVTFSESETGAEEGTISITGKTFLSRPMGPPPSILTGAPASGTETEPETAVPENDTETSE